MDYVVHYDGLMIKQNHRLVEAVEYGAAVNYTRRMDRELIEIDSTILSIIHECPALDVKM